MAKALLSLRGVRVQYGSIDAVRIPHLDVAPGEVLAVIGPNGAGKSTLLRMLGLLERPSEGEVCFRGQSVRYCESHLLPERRRIAVVFQDALLLKMTVLENVSLGLRFRRRRCQDHVGEWLDRFGIGGLSDRHGHSLSGGEAQRASLARAFVLNPELLLLDEPFAALDPPTRDALLVDLKKILEETRTTTVFVTHDLDEALALGDRVAVMVGGEIRQIGSPEQAFACPASEEVARFVGIENVLPATILSSSTGVLRVSVAGQDLCVPGHGDPGEGVLLCIRPDEIGLSDAVSADRPVGNGLIGTITQCIRLGSAVRIELDCGLPLVARVPRRSYEEQILQLGTTVLASFNPEATHVIAMEERPGLLR